MSKATAEGKVKQRINAVLACHTTWTYMPVPSGFGKQALDYLICYRGRFLAIEAKAPGEDLTGPQRLCAVEIYEAGGTVFIVSNPEGLNALARWLDKTDWKHRVK